MQNLTVLKILGKSKKINISTHQERRGLLLHGFFLPQSKSQGRRSQAPLLRKARSYHLIDRDERT